MLANTNTPLPKITQVFSCFSFYRNNLRHCSTLFIALCSCFVIVLAIRAVVISLTGSLKSPLLHSFEVLYPNRFPRFTTVG